MGAMSAPARRRSATPAVPGCAVLSLAGAVLLLITNVPVGAILLLVAAGVSLGVGRHKAQQAAERYRIRSLLSAEIARYHAMVPAEFERAVAFLCERDGCTGVRVVGGAGGLGADVIATAPDCRMDHDPVQAVRADEEGWLAGSSAVRGDLLHGARRPRRRGRDDQRLHEASG